MSGCVWICSDMNVCVWICLNMFRYDCMCLDMFEYVQITVSDVCEYSKNDESFNDKIHYITMILYLTFTINKKTVLST